MHIVECISCIRAVLVSLICSELFGVKAYTCFIYAVALRFEFYRSITLFLMILLMHGHALTFISNEETTADIA